jgi:carboxymethylenebutenolidase
MKRLLALLAACTAGTALFASADPQAKARLDKSPRHLEWVTVKNGDRPVKCFIGFPQVKGKATAVVLIHEIFGLSDWMRGMVDQFAEAGYIAIAPDFLSGAGPNGGGTEELGGADGARAKIGSLSADQVNGDLNAAVAYAAKLDGCNGKVVVGGFCWGGGKTFLYSTLNPDIKAGFVFYGQAPKPEDMPKIKAPIYGFYAGMDPRISAAVPKVTEDMKAAGKGYDPVIYDNAGHGFMRLAEDPDDATKPNHDANLKAASESWKKMKEILAKL